jgi:hypothetical protein
MRALPMSMRLVEEGTTIVKSIRLILLKADIEEFILDIKLFRLHL